MATQVASVSAEPSPQEPGTPLAAEASDPPEAKAEGLAATTTVESAIAVDPPSAPGPIPADVAPGFEPAILADPPSRSEPAILADPTSDPAG